MATATTARLTAEQFQDWLRRPEAAGGRFELVDGEVVGMPSPSEEHGLVCWLVGRVLTGYLSARQTGYLLTNDSGLVVRRDPDTVRGPDIMLFLDPIPARPSRSFCERVPPLVVEVRSPSDRWADLMRRVEQYAGRGTPLVWVVDPDDRIVTVFRPNELQRTLDETDELTGNGVLPDFACRVADLFPPTEPQTA